MTRTTDISFATFPTASLQLKNDQQYSHSTWLNPFIFHDEEQIDVLGADLRYRFYCTFKGERYITCVNASPFSSSPPSMVLCSQSPSKGDKEKGYLLVTLFPTQFPSSLTKEKMGRSSTQSPEKGANEPDPGTTLISEERASPSYPDLLAESSPEGSEKASPSDWGLLTLPGWLSDFVSPLRDLIRSLIKYVGTALLHLINWKVVGVIVAAIVGVTALSSIKTKDKTVTT
jgi:hypothetical protein